MWNSQSILVDGSVSPLHPSASSGMLLDSTVPASLHATALPLPSSSNHSIFSSPTTDQSHLRFAHDNMHLTTPNVSTSHAFHTPLSQARVQRSFAPLNLMDESEDTAGMHHDVPMADVSASPASVSSRLNLSSATVGSRVSSSRLRAKHERTLAAMHEHLHDDNGNNGNNQQQETGKHTETVGKSSLSLPSAGIDSHDLPLSILSPPATPARSSAALHTAPFLSSPTSHMELQHTQLGVNATPTRVTRSSTTLTRSPSLSLESPLQPAAAAAASSPTSRDSESSQSSHSASGSPSHPIASSFHSPDRALDLHFNASAYSPALRTPSAGMPRHDARYSLRHAAGMKTAFALNSPSVFSPAPSGMRGGGGAGSVRVIDDSPASTHSARLKLQQALNLDEPAPNASLLFSHSQTSSANNSPLLLGITASPSTLANLNLDAQHRSIGNISNHATGGDRMMPDEPAAPAVDETEASPKVQRKKKRAAETSEQQLKEEPQEEEKRSAPTKEKKKSAAASAAATAGSDAAAPALSATDPNASTTNKPCNCKKSKCLKLYCECFARQDFCRGCNCVGCFNTPDPENKPSRDKAILGTIERDPQAFFRAQLMAAHQNEQKQEKNTKGVKEEPEATAQVQLSKGLLGSLTASQAAAAAAAAAASSKAYRKGCHCKKSECLKKYCECYQAGVACDSSCKCVDCKNCYGSNGNSANDDTTDNGAAPVVEDDKKMKRTKSTTTKSKVSTSTSAPTSASAQPQFTPEMLAQMGAQMGIMPFLSNELMAYALQTNPAAFSAAAAAAAAMQQAQQAAAAQEAKEKQSTSAKAAESSDAAVKLESEAAPTSPVKDFSKTPNPHVLTTPPSASTAAHAISANTTPVPPVNNVGSQPIPPSTGSPPPRHSTRSSPASASSPATRRSSRGRVDKSMTPDLTLDRMEMDDHAGTSSAAASPIGKENRHPSSTDSTTPGATVTKRSNRIITSTSKAAEFKAQTQSNPRTLTKAAKTRLSSTLDKLPPTAKSSPSSSSALNGNESEESESTDDTPHSALRNRSKRQRLPPVM